MPSPTQIFLTSNICPLRIPLYHFPTLLPIVSSAPLPTLSITAANMVEKRKAGLSFDDTVDCNKREAGRPPESRECVCESVARMVLRKLAFFQLSSVFLQKVILCPTGNTLF